METFYKLFIIAILLSGIAIAATHVEDVFLAAGQQAQGAVPLLSAMLIAVGAIIAAIAYTFTKFVPPSEGHTKLVVWIALAVAAVFIALGLAGLGLTLMPGGPAGL